MLLRKIWAVIPFQIVPLSLSDFYFSSIVKSDIGICKFPIKIWNVSSNLSKKFRLNKLASQSVEQLFGHENKKSNFYNFLQVFDGSPSHLMKF